jgi:hypothetical protein
MKNLLFVLLAAVAASAATTTVNFDNPSCPNLNGSLTGNFGGINWGSAPWSCEIAGSPTDTTISVSWNQQVTSGTFTFVSPSVLNSLQVASSSGNGTFTLSTDAGESISSATITGGSGLKTITTNFTKPAGKVTVGFTGGWTIEIDNVVYTTSTAVGINVSPSSASVATNATQQFTATVTNCGTNCGVNWSVTTGTGKISSTGLFTAPSQGETDTVQAQAQADLTKTATANVTVTAQQVINAPVVTATTISVQLQANEPVTWAITSGPGTITSGGLFSEPSGTPPETTTVVATSTQDTTKTTTYHITLQVQ